jgi:hypothetical protein
LGGHSSRTNKQKQKGGMTMEIFLVWFGLAVLVGIFAETRRNRNGVAWFFWAVLISPLLAGILLAILREIPPPVTAHTSAQLASYYAEAGPRPVSPAPVTERASDRWRSPNHQAWLEAAHRPAGRR